ncbi:MAG: sigma-54-dependent Fis family transcriptional regulator [Methylomicrobium sp.]|nr:sigma-54-dependent Fis family transcriptional regulator [Methylomicrobium sp.]
MHNNNLLLIEDEPLLGSELARFFSKQGWNAVVADTLAKAKHQLIDQSLDPSVVISDMNLPDGNALTFLEKIRPDIGQTEWLFLTGYGTVADSVKALRLGAYDFLEKPCDLDRLNMLVEGAARSARAQRRLHQETNLRHSRYSLDALIGSSESIRRLKDMAGQLAKVRFTSLVITGETGSGKGLVTRLLHYSGQRAEGPLIELNCAAIPKDLLESELFGHEAGAFTGAKKRRHGLLEQANTGTLFLDEIGELDLDLQGKLLKAVEELKFRRVGGEQEISVDLQIIAATNRDLLESVDKGSFRRDLYHRLNVVNLHIPPLRERKEDLRELVWQFIAEVNARTGKNLAIVPESVWRKLEAYDWPGNIRELHNVIERCVMLSDSKVFPEHWLQLPNLPSTKPSDREDGIFIPLDGSLSLQDIEKRIIEEALNRSGMNVTAAARLLKATRETLRYRVQKHHLKYINE